MKKIKLTAKQEKFVKATLQGKNQTEAAIEAGYSPICANREGHRIANKPGVVQLVDNGRREINSKFMVTIEQKLEVLWEMVIDTKSSRKEKDIALKAITELNKMQGHYQPEKSVNVNMDLTRELQDIEEIRKLYKKEY